MNTIIDEDYNVFPSVVRNAIVSEHYFLASDAISNENTSHIAPAKGWLLGNTQSTVVCVLQLDNGHVVVSSGFGTNYESRKMDARLSAFMQVRELIFFRLNDSLMANKQEQINE